MKAFLLSKFVCAKKFGGHASRTEFYASLAADAYQKAKRKIGNVCLLKNLWLKYV